MKYNPIIIGCMRFAQFSAEDMNRIVLHCLDKGFNHFDHADIYGSGASEEVFGKAIKNIRREDLVIQSKCGICSSAKYPHYDLSQKHIIESVEGSLKRLGTDYLDILLLHRPDALVEPEEVAQAFDKLKKDGKVLEFGLSNHKSSQIELLKKYVKQPIVANQMQFSLAVADMVTNGMEVNMPTEGAVDRDDSTLDYCRLNEITIQAWSPLQMPAWQGCFINNPKYKKLNGELNAVAKDHNTTASAVAYAWILRHPAKIQVVTGSTSADHLDEAFNSVDISLSREEWYRLYLASGRILP